MNDATKLSRRERQIMDILYRLGSATGKEVMRDLADPPTYSTVRTILQKLVDKGHINYRVDGPKYVYYPIVDSSKASKSALRNVVQTFFQDSPLQAVNSLLGFSREELSDEELDELSALIEKTKQSRKQK